MMAGRYAHAKQFKLELTEFCERHGVRLDWVYFGSLATLRTMTKPQPETTPEQICLLCASCSRLNGPFFTRAFARGRGHTIKRTRAENP
jgi:hypothetical protein